MKLSRREAVRIGLVAAGSAVAMSTIRVGWAGVPGSGSSQPATAVPTKGFGGLARFQKILMLGDSNSAGNGQSEGFYKGVMGRVSRSIINASKAGFGSTRGYAFEALMAPYQEISESNRGWFANASGWEGGGACGNLMILRDGGYVELAERKLSSITFAYHPKLSKGASWQVSLGNHTIASGQADASGSTGEIKIPKAWGIFPNAAPVRFSCSKGSVYYQHAETVESQRPDAPYIWCAPEGSQGFAEYSTDERISSITPHVNARKGKTLVWIALGSNNFLPRSLLHVPPDQYIALLDALVGRWRESITGDKEFALVIPPKPRLALPFGTYEEYAEHTVKYAESRPDISVIRTDLSVLGGEATERLYSADGVHLSTEGHRAWAKVSCDHFGIPCNDQVNV